MTVRRVGLSMAAALVLAVAWATVRRRRRDRWVDPAAPGPAESRLVECRGCFDELPVDGAHVVVARLADGAEVEAFRQGGGGTAMVARYHPGCCPGGCEHEEAHTAA